MSTRADVQVTDFTFPDEEGEFSLYSFFFYMGKVRENRESALKVLKVARAPDMHRVSFIVTRDILQVSPFVNVIRSDRLAYFVYFIASYESEKR